VAGVRLRLQTFWLGIAVIAISAVHAAAPELELVHAWSVEGPGRFDASGLAIRDGRFFVVTDRHQDTIFELEFEGDIARAKTVVTFTPPQPLPEVGYLDNEGLALAEDGGFYVASEWGFAIYHVPPAGGAAEWVTPNVRAAGATVGLFATKDAFVEGVAVLGEGWFLLAAERQPRGLVEVMGGNPPIRVCAQEMDASNYPAPPGRSLDFADLCVWHDRVFALARNQHLVVGLRRDTDGSWAEDEAWSYAKTENGAPHRFVDMTYGQGEGLAVDDQFIYVILDNNALAREDHPDDRRTWLFAFRNVIRR
jgi:Esterase-like activity of phytase